MRWLSVAVTLFVCSYLPLSGQTEFQIPKGESMRIDLDHVSFELPRGFVDKTAYSFQTRDQEDELIVSFGARPPEATDLATMFALRKSNIDIIIAGQTEMGEESDTRLDGLPARMFWCRFEDGGVLYESSLAVALPMPDTYVQISYIYKAKDKQARERFHHILQSVVPARGKVDSAAAPGYVRRWAERMTLEVPSTLIPPHVYEFVSQDRQFQLALYWFDSSDEEPTQSEDTAEDESTGTVSNRATETVQVGKGSALVVSYVLTKNDGVHATQESVRRAYLSLPTIARVHLEARGPLARSTELDAILNRWIQSFQSR